MLGGQPGAWGRRYCPVLFMDSSVCVLRSLCLSLEWISYFQMRLSLLRVLSFLLPSFPALPTLRQGVITGWLCLWWTGRQPWGPEGSCGSTQHLPSSSGVAVFPRRSLSLGQTV